MEALVFCNWPAKIEYLKFKNSCCTVIIAISKMKMVLET